MNFAILFWLHLFYHDVPVSTRLSILSTLQFFQATFGSDLPGFSSVPYFFSKITTYKNLKYKKLEEK